jgi:hypothetical protein
MDCIEIIFATVNITVLAATVYVIRKSPIDAVNVGRQLNEINRKDDAKRHLFFALFSYRGNPTHQVFVDNLNRIDMVFHDVPAVIEAWHNLYSSLGVKGQVDELKVWTRLRTILLSEMAQHLQYPNLSNLDMMEYYSPEGHVHREQQQLEFWLEQKRYYENSNKMIEGLINQQGSQTGKN